MAFSMFRGNLKEADKKDLFLSIVNKYVGASNNRDEYIQKGLTSKDYAKVLTEVFENVSFGFTESRAKLAFAMRQFDITLSVSLLKKCFEEITNSKLPEDLRIARIETLPLAWMICKNLKSFNNNDEAQKLIKKIDAWIPEFQNRLVKEEARREEEAEKEKTYLWHEGLRLFKVAPALFDLRGEANNVFTFGKYN